ncbi:MAG: hypothetical protein J6N18_11525 [Kiritimatiellae bacterium]|nr:hypothetical protein [Kiritimatiellia bacterium]
MENTKDISCDRLGDLISSALRDERARMKLPPDFSSRLERRIKSRSSTGNTGTTNGRGRLLRIAASIAAVASFAAFAAWIGNAIIGSDALPNAQEPTTGDTNMIMAKKVAALAGAAVLTVSAPAAKLSSEPTFIFLKPETSSFWNTATNSSMTLPIDYPNGASVATLSVKGVDYYRTYLNITEDSFDLELPAPDSPKTENVYDLTLTFNDGTVRTAKLGLIQGLDSGAKGSARCLAPADGRVWNTAKYRAVLPIPHGMESFSVKLIDGAWENIEPGLNGAQGCYALSPIRRGDSISLSYIADGMSHVASLLGGGDGFFVIMK